MNDAGVSVSKSRARALQGKMMGGFSQNLLETVNKYEVFSRAIRVMPINEGGREIIKPLYQKYLNSTQLPYPEFDGKPHIRLGCSYSLHWRDWMFDYLVDKNDLILFFWDRFDDLVFFIPDSELLLDLLSITHLKPDDFFITNSKGDFLLFYDQHSCIHACGQAQVWVENRLNDIFIRLGIAPQPLYLTEIQFRDWGSELIIPCTIDRSGQNMLANLIFRKARILGLVGRSSEGQPTKVYEILFGKELHFGPGPRSRILHLPTFIATTHFSLEMAFDELIIEPLGPHQPA